MRKKEEKLTLCQWIIRKIDTKSYRAGTLTGMLHPIVEQKMLDAVGGLRLLTEQAREIQRDIVLGNKIRFAWKQMGTDIEKIHFSVDIMEELCRREGIEDPRVRQLRYIHLVRSYRQELQEEWLYPYFDHLLIRLEAGDEVLQPNLEDEGLFISLCAVANNKQPVWERVFSAAVLGEVISYDEKTGKMIPPTKRFERKYRRAVCSILKNEQHCSPYYEEGMSDDELLAAHGIFTYAQTLEWKGPLSYRLGDGMIDSSGQIYGTVLNAQTLEHAEPVCLHNVWQIMIIENKANYEDMPYEDDKLYIYCHGFFSPKECRFLKCLEELAASDTEFLHWGDMDYGGIRIFQFNRKKLFPKLKPFKMGKNEYMEALHLGAVIELEESKRKSLEKMDAMELNDLKACILEYNMEIEQEVLLAKQYLEHADQS